jgi:hypothetical protein
LAAVAFAARYEELSVGVLSVDRIEPLSDGGFGSPVASQPSRYVRFFDDFLNPDFTATTLNGYTVLTNGTAPAITSLGLNGELTLEPVTNPVNMSVSISLGDTGVQGPIQLITNSGKRVWAEFRLKVLDTNYVNATFVGLVATNVGTTLLTATTGALATNLSYIGFWGNAATGTVSYWDAVYSLSTVAGSVMPCTGIVAITENTYVRLGIKYDGSGRVSYFVNGTELANHTTWAAATCPESLALTPMVMTKQLTLTNSPTRGVTIDYIDVVTDR